MSAPSWPSAPLRPRTFLNAVTVSGHTAVVTVTLHGIRVSGEGPPVSLPFSHPTQLHLPPVTLVLGPGGRLRLRWGPRLELLVLRHRYSRPGALQRDHLGFYVTDSSRLSPRAGGLLGECRPHPHGVALSAAQGAATCPLSFRPPAGHPAVPSGDDGSAVPGCGDSDGHAGDKGAAGGTGGSPAWPLLVGPAFQSASAAGGALWGFPVLLFAASLTLSLLSPRMRGSMGPSSRHGT